MDGSFGNGHIPLKIQITLNTNRFARALARLSGSFKGRTIFILLLQCGQPVAKDGPPPFPKIIGFRDFIIALKRGVLKFCIYHKAIFTVIFSFFNFLA